MSFSESKDNIEEGDTVFLYVGVTNIYAIEVKPTITNRLGEEVEYTFQTRFGALKVAELIGTPYGSRVRLSKGWANVLYPTPELWTLCLPHRTQILYTADISMIVTQLDIGPGSVVCEAGTGSGSLSHALLRAVGPTGHLHTRDFHKERTDIAAKEFTAHGLSSRVTALQRDVCANGFGVENIADAVFLDLPGPWNTIHHALSTLKDVGGRLCSFSPCIEQVSRTCDVLRASGLTEIVTLECLNREFQVKLLQQNIIPIGYKDYNDNEKDVSKWKKMKLEEENSNKEVQDKKENVAEEKSPNEIQDEIIKENVPVEKNTHGREDNKEKNKEEMKKFMSAHTPLKMAGHTGFLTFATLPPGIRSQAIIAAMKLAEKDKNLIE